MFHVWECGICSQTIDCMYFCQKNVTMFTFQSKMNEQTKKWRSKIYIRAVNFNEATKKAFQWRIVCSLLDTSNFISHRALLSKTRSNGSEQVSECERIGHFNRIISLFNTKMLGIAVKTGIVLCTAFRWWWWRRRHRWRLLYAAASYRFARHQHHF